MPADGSGATTDASRQADPMRIDAITFRVADMAASVAFYEALGFNLIFGGASEPFSTLTGDDCYVNLTAPAAGEQISPEWGRVIFHVDDVDALHAQALAAGLVPRAAPRDAPWGERMFPINDPDGHDLSFAKRL